MKLAREEMLEVVDRSGRVLRLARRSEIHGDPSLIHRVVHVLVFDTHGRLLLQKRSQTKDVAPGKWDTSVGGHVSPGEEIGDAARREMKEELGISECELAFLYRYLFSGASETELVHTFSCVHSGPVNYDRQEIETVEFRELNEISNSLGSGLFSEHFECEISTYLGLTGTSLKLGPPFRVVIPASEARLPVRQAGRESRSESSRRVASTFRKRRKIPDKPE